MPAGRPLEPVGDGRPRWMAAGPRERVTEPGVQVDSSVASLAVVLVGALSCWYCSVSLVDSGHHWSSSDVLAAS
jgi:hypothetical protein